ncbi:MAG: hypothetical protein ABSD64_03320 [Terriglobales bacterium]
MDSAGSGGMAVAQAAGIVVRDKIGTQDRDEDDAGRDRQVAGY